MEESLSKTVVINSCTPTCVSAMQDMFIQNPSLVQPKRCSSPVIYFSCFVSVLNKLLV